jgi:abequosyltransferase
MMNRFLVSVCIPSYNRPNELNRLLKSVDSISYNQVQIVICEDKAPKRNEIRDIVETFRDLSNYHVKYIENEQNLGHGGNFRQCIDNADGEFVIFMGDDDMFIPHELDGYIEYLKENKDCGYILRSSRQVIGKDKYEYFKYYSSNRKFLEGVETLKELFLKSVFMSGFTIKRTIAVRIKDDSLDDTLLFQLLLLAESCLNYPSAYYHTPIVQGVGDGVSYFGTNAKESDHYIPGELVTNNINFIHGFIRISEYIDNKYNIQSSRLIKIEMSKYSFPLMSLERNLGVPHFVKHCNKLRNLGLSETIYFYIYFFALLFLGEPRCKRFIIRIKSLIGRRISL